MTPYALIYDGALFDPDSVWDHASRLSYAGEVGPDGVTYPNVSTKVPRETVRELEFILSRAMRGAIDIKLPPFFRLSLEDTRAPHWAHTDAIISDYLALVYLTPSALCRGGTVIVEHESGMRVHPTDEVGQGLWRRDTNRKHRWNIVATIPMRFNRLAIMPANLFHAALPEGFGTSASDGRLVLITFFSKRKG